MARLIVRSEKEEAASAFADTLAGAFKEAMKRIPAPSGFVSLLTGDHRYASATFARRAPPIRLLGPAECPVFRLNNFYRFHFQVQSDKVPRCCTTYFATC